MEQRAFGETGITVPVVGMGTWKSFDVSTAAEEADRAVIVERALAAGTTLFDTSPMYGESERVLGAAVAHHRDHVIIADKVWTASAAEGRKQIERALEWYGGVVDIYQVHNLLNWQEHLPVLEDLKSRGAVRVVGATHYQHSAFPELMALMRTGRLDMIQIPYNAADRVVEREVLHLADELNIGVLVMQPLGTGRLIRRAPSAQEMARLERFGVTTWAQALLKWILSDTRVHCVIPATSKPERAAENAVAGKAPWFDPDTREYVARMLVQG